MVTIQQTLAEMVEQLSRDLGLSAPELASALGISPRTLDRWRNGEVMPQREARQRLANLTALDRRLHDTFVDEDVAGWLRTDNRYLGGLTPAEVIAVGRFDRVEGALEVIDSGIFL
jgi:transcriptional regulator with XRE-family HTH domain